MKIDGIAWDNYVDWQPEHAEVVLDGRFKAEEIEKIHAAVNGASLADAQAEIARLRAALVSAVSFVEHADVSSGVCCCGDSMKGHGDVFDTGHSPRDMWDYAAEGFIKETRALLDTK